MTVETLCLRGASLIDGTGRSAVPDSSVVVRQGRITSMEAVEAEEELDLSGLWLLPGLIDAHAHLGIFSMSEQGRISPAMTAALMFRNAAGCLESGHTTVRDLGGVDGGLVEVLSRGLVPGPRLLPAGPIICQTGGHGDLRRPFVDEQHPGLAGLCQFSRSADGPHGVRAAAREAFRRGATQLKICTSGGIVSHSDRLEDTQFSVAEIQAAVEEAAARATYVTAHAFTTAAVANAIDGGVRCIEHGSFVDESTLDRMAREGVALVPTMTAVHLIQDRWQELGIPANALERLQEVDAANRRTVPRALARGVVVGSGSDLIGTDQRARGTEIALKAEVVGPMEAIISATATNAHILGLGEEIGTVEVGKRADLVAIDFNPLEQPELFSDHRRVRLVVRDGFVAKDSRRMTVSDE